MEFKIGDRVSARLSDGTILYTGTVYAIYDRTVHLLRDDGRIGGGIDGTWLCATLQLVLENPSNMSLGTKFFD